ncbi:MAG: hypothetical protein ABSA93_15370 [Streptosporangiaceae bacterium]|jgi:hypothetical protein
MRRSFQVATIFTGVAALAGGFGPAAHAATTGPNALHPEIANQECGANNNGVSKWLHLYYPNNDHPAECFHGTGTTSADATIQAFCAGSTSGYIFGHLTASGNGFAVHYGRGSTRYYISSLTGIITNWTISKITISKMTGADHECT